MQEVRKILRVVSEKTALPTNQLLPATLILQDFADAGPKKALESLKCFKPVLSCLLIKNLFFVLYGSLA